MTGPRALPPLPPNLDPRGRRRAMQAARAEQGAQGARRAGRQRRSPAGRVFLGACTVLSVILLVFAGTYWWKFHQFSAHLDRVDISGSQASTDIDGSDTNILVVGNDDRTDMTNAEVHELHTGRSGGSLNTDTMMIIHIPADGSRATLISLPRDSYVQIPGFGKNKLNSAYPAAYTAAKGSLNDKRQAGANLLVKAVQSLTGLRIDHYAQVDLLGFYRISNALGGIQVNMCAAVAEQKSGIRLHKGVNVIQGVQALAFVRQRYGFPNGLGDLDRVKRQQYFLTAAFRKVTSAGILLNPFKLQDLLKAVQSSLFVDTGLDPLGLGRQLQNLTANHIVGETIPTDGFADTGVGRVVVVNPAQVQAWIKNVVNPPKPKPAAHATTTHASSTHARSGTSSASAAPDAHCIY